MKNCFSTIVTTGTIKSDAAILRLNPINEAIKMLLMQKQLILIFILKSVKEVIICLEKVFL
ncbi:TPA: hypothetical protein ACHDTU_001566 [Campylobacter jejuni]